MSALKVSRGNCPCLVRGPESLELTGDGFACGAAVCEPETLWQSMPPVADGRLLDPAGQAGRVVQLRLSQLAGLFDGSFGEDFLLVTAESVQSVLRLHTDAPVDVDEMTWAGPASRAELLERLAEARAAGRRTSVLWLADDEFVHLDEHLVDGVKLAAVSWFSTGFTAESLERYLAIITQTDYEGELELESRLVSHLEEADRLTLRTPALGASATFEHQRGEHWFSLHGPLRWGDQTVLPTGEMSVLTHESGAFDSGTSFGLTGTVVLHGSPIVHRGDRSVSLEDTQATYGRLSPMHDHAVVARMSEGYIEEVTAPTPEDRGLRDAFLGLFRAEPRYRRVHEFGFGTHPLCREQVLDNFHPNERWPGIHLGLGLGGHTPFHIDLALTSVDVVLERSSGPLGLYQALGLR